MAHSSSTYRPSRSSFVGEAGGRVCSLDFRPSRFFGCRVDKVLSEFFSCDDPDLAKMPEAIWDLTQGTVRPGLDDRVLVEAVFSPGGGHGRASVTLFYRLPSVESNITDKVLRLLDRRSTRSGYYRLGDGQARSLRGATRVRTSIVGHDSGESLLVTTMIFSLSAVAPKERGEPLMSSQAATVSVTSENSPVFSDCAGLPEPDRMPNPA